MACRFQRPHSTNSERLRSPRLNGHRPYPWSDSCQTDDPRGLTQEGTDLSPTHIRDPVALSPRHISHVPRKLRRLHQRLAAREAAVGVGTEIVDRIAVGELDQ